ncbi:MAG: hypothetical protein K6F87_08060, partial [Lachnospiraceae bacterium]|nr:hypothetical protein [Lachnospiraceae bacterium]
MSKSTALNVNITASRVGAYYDHACPRFTAYNIIADPTLVGWSERSREHTASQEAGKVWEKEALCILEESGFSCYAEDENENVVSDFKSMSGRDAKFGDLSEETTIDIFRSPDKYLRDLAVKKTGYIYQTTISATESFMNSLIFGNEELSGMCRDMFEDRDECIHANWSICKPDLIRVDIEEDGTPVFSVIDMKHAKHAHLSHKVQVAVYVRLLENLFKDRGISGRINREEGYLWNFKKAEPRAFDLSVVMPYMDRFFKEELPVTLKGLKEVLPDTFTGLKDCLKDEVADSLNRHFCAIPTQMCEWCDNYQVCIKWQKEHEPVTLLPYLSSFAQEYLRTRQIPLNTAEFKSYVSDDDNRTRMSEDCFSLKKLLR